MKKILIVFNGVAYPAHVVDFAMEVARERSSSLHAVFMKPLHTDEGLQYPFPNDLSIAQDNVTIEDQNRTDVEAIEGNKQVFRDDCGKNNITYSIDDNIEIPLEELIEHSKFSDLIVADVNDDLGDYTVGDLLSRTQCPVILVQRQSTLPNRVLLAYDGSISSIQAIKMYSYLLPEWRKLNTILVQVNPDDQGKEKNQEYLQDWLGQHFNRLENITLHGNVEDEFSRLLDDSSQHSMMVMGSYGKKGIARLFHESLANKIMKVSHASLFIFHQ